MANDKGKNGHNGHGHQQQEGDEIAQAITQQVAQAITQQNSITGVSLTIDAADKSHVNFNHTEFRIKIYADQSNKADQDADQNATNCVVETTVICGKGGNETTSVATQTITQDAAQALSQANSITGIALDIQTGDKSHVKFNHVDFNVKIVADQSNRADQDVEQNASNAAASRDHGRSSDEVTQVIEQDASQSLDQSNSIVGTSVSVDAGNKSHVMFNHTDFDTFIWADQSNKADQDIEQNARNVSRDGDSFRFGSSDDVTQTVDQSAAQSVDQSNSIVGTDLDISSGKWSHVMLNHVEFDTVIIADQSNYADQDIEQNAYNVSSDYHLPG